MHVLLASSSDHVRSNPSLQQGIRIDIEFATTRGTNLREEVNQSPAEVGKKEDPPNNRLIQHDNQLSARVTPSQHAVRTSDTVCACRSLQ